MNTLCQQFRTKTCARIAILVALSVLLAACGGSMGGDPSTGASSSPAHSVNPGSATHEPPPAAAAPTATNGSLAATMGAPTMGNLSGAGSGTLTYAIATPPQDGTAAITNAATGAFTYTSYPNFTGNDTFQFTVTNSAGSSQPATETLQVTSPALGAPKTVANIGVNLDWVCYWCAMQPFVNVTRQAAGFNDPNTGTQLIEEGKLDTNGWPEADFSWMVLAGGIADGTVNDPGPTSPLIGKYHLSFNGIATIWDDGGTVEDQQYNAATNTTTATLDQHPMNPDGSGMFMLLSFGNTQRTQTSATGTGITNIQIIRPQFAPNGTKWWDSPAQEFTNPFLDSLKGFSTIRYLNWTGALGSPEINWSDRTPANWPVANGRVKAAPEALPYLGSGEWFDTGASWESAIDVANATHTDMWINIPLMATDDYVKSLAALLKSKLDPGLHVYVEWSDEIWNWAPPYWAGTRYASDQVNALIANDPVADKNYNANCPGAQFECYVAERVMQFSQDFAAVYGQPAITAEIRPVLCTQVVQPTYLAGALSFIARTYGPPANYYYGTCGAPYWYPPSNTSTLPSGSTLGPAVAAMAQGIPDATTNLVTDSMIDLYYGLHNLTYEGGPYGGSITVTGDTSAQQGDFYNALVVAPGMKQQVIEGLSDAFGAGVDMYMYYELEGPNNYAATIDPTNLDAPRLVGLRALTGQMITRSAGTVVPGTITMSTAVYAIQANTIVAAYQMHNCWAPADANSDTYNCSFSSSVPIGDGYIYLITSPTDGNYSVSLGMNDVQSTAGCTLTLAIDTKPTASFTVQTAPAGMMPAVNAATVTLSAGLHTVELLNASTTGNCAVSTMRFASD